MRAAVLTTSPETIPSPASGRASSATRASPVVMPIRTSSWPSVGERLANRERSAHGAFRIVLVRDRRAEDRHDRITDELLDGAAETLELGAHAARGTAGGAVGRPPDPSAPRVR